MTAAQEFDEGLRPRKLIYCHEFHMKWSITHDRRNPSKAALLTAWKAESLKRKREEEEDNDANSYIDEMRRLHTKYLKDHFSSAPTYTNVDFWLEFRNIVKRNLE